MINKGLTNNNLNNYDCDELSNLDQVNELDYKQAQKKIDELKNKKEKERARSVMKTENYISKNRRETGEYVGNKIKNRLKIGEFMKEKMQEKLKDKLLGDFIKDRINNKLKSKIPKINLRKLKSSIGGLHSPVKNKSRYSPKKLGSNENIDINIIKNDQDM